MNPLDRSPDEYEAASFMAGLSTANADAACSNAARKREHDDDDDVAPPCRQGLQVFRVGHEKGIL
ncbi:hypothetical protein HJC23_010790 [Cyclotella cryptica]|uniref:Uncharacterized protein n=1 Tax=Cyclotella cryptica TaxID=29204 RepID=A0ABD3NER4_9STRA